MIGPPVHHFVVILVPAYGAARTGLHRIYGLREPVFGWWLCSAYAAGAFCGEGYRTVWSVTDLAQMFSDLLTSATAWQTYFGAVGAAQANKITYWKYKVTSLDSAVANVNKYR